MKIQLAKAKESGLKLDASEIKNIDDSIQQQIIDSQEFGGGNRIRANKAFEEIYGIGLDAFRATQLEKALVQKFQQKTITDTKITDDEIKKEYDKDPKKFDEVTVTHVLFLYEGTDNSKRTKEESKKLADDTLEKVKAGEDIKELAKTLSEDTAVTENGGVYTFAKDGQFVPEFEDWAFNAKVGDTGIVETSFGYHVMKLDKRETKQLNDVKDKIKTELSQTKYTTELDGWRKDPKYAVKPNDPVYAAL